MENSMQTVPEGDERRSGPPASPFATPDPLGQFLSRYWGVQLAGIVALIDPVKTFAGFADILGFVFLGIGVLWMVQAFAERLFNPYWWLTLVSAVLMVVLAFWVSGQFFLTRAATLLVFVGIWALMKGITDIVRAFQIRSLR